MKILLLLTFLIFYCTQANTFNLLTNVNPQWYNYKDTYNPKHNYTPDSEISTVQLHLYNVIELLKENTNKIDLTKSQYENRIKNIKILTDYANRGLFPINIYKNDRTPIFVDEQNTHCAVGYLLKLDKKYSLINYVRNADNFIKILDIDNQSFNEWQYNSGFTLNELALIQPWYGEHYKYDIKEREIDNKAQVNGTLQVFDQNINSHYVFGKISGIDGIEVNNLAMFNGIEWENAGFGIVSEVFGMGCVDVNAEKRVFACGNDILPTGNKIDLAILSNNNNWVSTGISTNGTIKNIYFIEDMGYAIGEFTIVNGLESHNFFMFDPSSFVVESFGDQFSSGVSKLVYNKLVNQIAILADGNIYEYKNNDFHILIEGEEIIDFGTSQNNIYYAINSQNQLADLIQGDSELIFRLNHDQNGEYLKIFDFLKYSTEEKFLQFLVKRNDKYYIQENFVFGAMHNYEIENPDIQYFNSLVGSSDDLIHSFTNGSSNDSKYHQISAIFSSLPIHYERFDIQTLNNEIHFDIDLENNSEFNLKLIDLSGNIVGEKQYPNGISNDYFKVNSNGLYLISLEQEGQFLTRKILINN